MIEKNSSVVNIFTKIPFIPMETYLRNGAGLFDLKFHKFVAQSQKMNKFEQRTQHFYLISEKIFYLFKLNDVCSSYFRRKSKIKKIPFFFNFSIFRIFPICLWIVQFSPEQNIGCAIVF